MEKIPSQSVDYAIMGKSQKVRLIACDIDWNDVESFDALSEELSNDNSYILKKSNRVNRHRKFYNYRYR